MTDEELRTLVRDTVQRHLAAALAPSSSPAAGQGEAGPRPHPGFARYTLPRGAELDGPCLIEPAVHCNHCGYCQSHGY
jgi:hypothetical protein